MNSIREYLQTHNLDGSLINSRDNRRIDYLVKKYDRYKNFIEEKECKGRLEVKKYLNIKTTNITLDTLLRGKVKFRDYEYYKIEKLNF